MTDVSLLHAQNSAFLDDLYSDYLENPEKVPEDWRQFFAGMEKTDGGPRDNGRILSHHLSAHAEEQVKVLSLINANRYRGHREADLDPLNLYERPTVPDLHAAYYGFGKADMDKVRMQLKEVLSCLMNRILPKNSTISWKNRPQRC